MGGEIDAQSERECDCREKRETEGTHRTPQCLGGKPGEQVPAPYLGIASDLLGSLPGPFIVGRFCRFARHESRRLAGNFAVSPSPHPRLYCSEWIGSSSSSTTRL